MHVDDIASPIDPNTNSRVWGELSWTYEGWRVVWMSYLVSIYEYGTFYSPRWPLNYRMTVEGYLNLNEGVGGLIPNRESFFLTWRENQEPTHHKVGSKAHPASKGFLSRVGPTCSNLRRIAQRCI